MPVAPRNLSEEISKILNVSSEVAESLLASNPALAELSINQIETISKVLLGKVDSNSFLEQHPEFQEGWDNAVNTGDDPEAWLLRAINAAPYIDQKSLPRTGGFQDVVTESTRKAGEAFDEQNPGLAGNASQLSGALGGLNLVGGDINAVVSPDIRRGQNLVGTAAWADAANAASGGGSGAGAGGGAGAGAGNAPQYSPNVSNLAGLFLGASAAANNQPLTQIQSELQRQASSDLQLGGRLGEGELRDISQAIGSRFSARGLGYSPAAAAQELLGTDTAMRQRQNERRGFAGAVDAAGFGQQTTNRGLGATYAGLGQSANSQFGQLGLGYSGLNENARQYDAGFDQRGAMFDATNDLNTQFFNASREDSRLAGDRSFFLGGLGAQGGIASQRAGSQSAGQSIAGQAGGFAYDPASFINPLYNAGREIFSNNFNAATSRQNANRNSQASLLGSGIDFLGNNLDFWGGLFGNDQEDGNYGNYGYGGSGGWNSSITICWVAREVYGADNPKWKQFRKWMLEKAPDKLLLWYIANGERVAEEIRYDEPRKTVIRAFMDTAIAENA